MTTSKTTAKFPAPVYRDTLLAPVFGDAKRYFLEPRLDIEYAHTLMLTQQGIMQELCRDQKDFRQPCSRDAGAGERPREAATACRQRMVNASEEKLAAAKTAMKRERDSLLRRSDER